MTGNYGEMQCITSTSGSVMRGRWRTPRVVEGALRCVKMGKGCEGHCASGRRLGRHQSVVVKRCVCVCVCVCVLYVHTSLFMQTIHVP